MRKIETKREREGKRRRNQIIVGVVLVFVMLFSTLGFAFQNFYFTGGDADSDSSEGKVTYNDFEFTNVNGLWVLGNFVFKNTPQQVQDVGTGLKSIDNYQGKPLYIYSENEEAEIEVYVNLGQVAERVQKACIEGEECSTNLPVKTCTDNFIIIKQTNNTVIRQENNCVYIEGTQENLVALADQFLFKILGIK